MIEMTWHNPTLELCPSLARLHSNGPQQSFWEDDFNKGKEMKQETLH